MPDKAELVNCPSCQRPIFVDHPYAWCQECGEPLPEDIRTLIPSQQRLTAETASGGAGLRAADSEGEQTPYKSAERFAIANPGPLTVAILASCVLIALFTLSWDWEVAWARQYAWGAQINEEVNAGEWWRLLSATFLHATWTHLIANMYALFVVGSVVERAFGRTAFLAIYVLAGLGGSLASYFFLDAPTVGASGAIFGLYGAVLWLLPRHEKSSALPLSRDQLGGLGGWAAYSLFMGFTTPHINNAAHLGGLATGVAVATALPTGRAARAVAMLCTTMLALTGVRMGLSARGAPLVAAYIRSGTAAHRNDTTSAMLELDRAVPFPRALETRAGLRLQHRDYKGALHDADALLASGRKGESRRRAHFVRAAALFELGQPAQAFSALQPALESRSPETRQAALRLRAEILRALPGGELPASVRTLRIEPTRGLESAP